jgi:Ni/Co efflux regulator RcnB
MRRIATAAIALCLMGGTAALAEPGHNDGGHNDGGHNDGGHHDSGHNDSGHNNGGHSNGGQPQNVQHGAPQMFERSVQGGPPNPQHNDAPQVYERHFDRGQHDQGQQLDDRHFDRGQRDLGPQVFEHRDRGDQQGRDFHNDDRFRPDFGAPGFRPGGDRPRYSPEFFPRMFHPRERFEWRDGHWRGPPGWYYRSWFYGEILPWGWFDEGYWINDYWFYDLPVPPYGFEWIRSGPDVLLVDLRSGMIVEVVPGIFY